MTSHQLKQMLQTLKNQYPKGLSTFELSKKSTLSLQDTRKRLTQYDDYVVILNDGKGYQLNKFGKFKGDVDSMIEDYEQLIAPKESNNYLLWFMLGTGALSSLFAAITVSNT